MVPIMDVLIVDHCGLDPSGAVLTLEHVSEVSKELPKGKCKDSKPHLSETLATPGTQWLPFKLHCVTKYIALLHSPSKSHLEKPSTN